MHKLSAAVIIALLVATLSPATSATSATSPTIETAGASPTRVLIVGDSVTQGSRGDFTWRYFAWKALEQAGESVDFVGPRTGTFGVHDDTGTWDWDYHEPDAYADPDFDQDHGAIAGGRMGPDENHFYESIDRTSQSAEADIIMSLWGINDLWHKDDGPAEVAAIYRDWVASARSVNPDVDFVIGELPFAWYEEVPPFNALIRELALELSTDRSLIVIAQMTTNYTQEADSLDHVHPNTQGQQKIAGMMGGALVELLSLTQSQPEVIPEPLPVEPPPVAPAPVLPPVDVAQAVSQLVAPAAPRRVRAVRSEARTVVTWRSSAEQASYTVRCGTKTKVVYQNRAALRARATSCRVRAVSAAGSSAWMKTWVRVG